MKKAVFFDIDGTLFQMGNEVPKSTVTAIHKLRENGIYAFLCSGRARVMIPDDPILKVGFDGIIGACGMYGEFEGKKIFEEELEQELILRTLKTLDRYDAIVAFEGNQNIYVRKDKRKNREKHWLEKAVEDAVPNNLLPIEEHVHDMHISKWTCIAMKEDPDALFANFRDDYDEMRHEKDIAEFVKKGVSKGSGIHKMCHYLGIDIENTYAFGDSINDVEMLQTCQVGIAMGNGMEIAKQNADYVTSDLNDDGIYNACVHFGLI